MSIPEISDSEDSPVLPGNRKSTLAWMIVAQVLSVLFILASLGFGAFFSLVGSGALAGGALSYIEILLFAPPLFLIPIIVSWVMYKKGKVRTALILTTATFVVLACPCLLGVLVISLA